MLQEKIAHSLQLIRDVLSAAENPVIAWSSGKDSQVLLWLVDQVRAEVPLVFFRNAEDAERFAFADDFLAQRRGITFTPRAECCDVVARGGVVELLTVRSLAPQSYAFCGIGIDDSVPPQRCGLEILNRPPSAPELDFEVVFVGHRGDDICPVQGSIPLVSERGQLANCQMIYPLKDWLESDIWDCLEMYNIPLDPRRYDVVNRREWESKRFNPDYDALCVNCLKPSLAGQEVDCFLTGKTASIADIIQPEQRAREYRRTFTNLSE